MTTPSAAARLGEERRYLLIRPTGGAGWLAAALIAITVAGGLARAWATWNNYFLYEQFDQGSTAVGDDDLVAAEDLVVDLFWINFLAFGLAAIAFIVWLHKARRNSEILCLAPHRHSTKRLSWAWLVPVINTWIPFQVVSDIWKASKPDTPRTLDSLRAVPGSALLGLWWGCWLTAYALQVIGAITLVRPATTTLDELRSIALVTTVDEMLTAAAGVLLIIRVGQVIRWQSQPRT